MRLFFSTGEPSGDLHAANLVRQLQQRDPSLEVFGFGGPQMQAAGCKLLYPLTELALMWFLRVGLNLHRFADLLGQADRFLRRRRPDGVVLVDFPGFNWWIARRAHAQGIPVFYYVPPQIWAWASWRVRKMRAWVDHVLCSLPFEKTWYAQRGVRATYVGHPYFDEIFQRHLDLGFLHDCRQTKPSQQTSNQGPKPRAVSYAPLSRQPRPSIPTIGLLPGSRRQEVTANFPLMLKTARRLHEQLPAARFLVACFKEEHRQLVREMAGRCMLPLELHVGRTPEIMHLADVCLAVSGSVGLELLWETTPTVVLYKVTTPALWVGRAMMRTPFISLVNLLAEQELFPEYLTDKDESPAITQHLYRWLTEPDLYRDAVQQLTRLKERVARPGASACAADYIAATLGRKSPIPRPHNALSGARTLAREPQR